MSDLYDSLPEQSSPQVAWSGIIATNPPDFATKVAITIPGIDPNLRWTNCKWQARNDIDMPIRGNSCLAIFDDNNQIWVVAWWPF